MRTTLPSPNSAAEIRISDAVSPTRTTVAFYPKTNPCPGVPKIGMVDIPFKISDLHC